MISLKKITSNKYYKDIYTLSSFSIVSQVFLVSIQPLITRLFGQIQLGNYEIFYSIFTIFAVIISLKYDIVIVSSKDDKDIAKIFQVGLIVTFIFSFVLLIFSTSYFFLLLGISFENTLGILFLPIWICLFGINNLLISVCNRRKQFNLIALSTLIKTITLILMQLLLGLIYKSFVIIIASNIISEIISIIYYYVNIDNVKALLEKNRIEDIKRVAKLYKQQPLYSTPAALLNTLSFSLIVFFIQRLYSDVSLLAFYSISLRIINLPSSFIGNNIGKVYFSTASESWNKIKSFRLVYIKSILSLTIIALVSYIFLLVTPINIYEIIFGNGWGKIGTIIKILIPLGIFRTIYSPVSVTLTVINKQIYEIVIQLFIITSIVIVYCISLLQNLNFEMFILLISLALSGIYLACILVFYRISKGDE